MNDEQILEFYANTANEIVSKLNASRRQGTVTKAVELLIGRIVGAGNSLRVLYHHAPQQSAFDGLMVLRGIYDAMVQTLFILNDPAQRDERSKLYLDFYWMEKQQYILLFDKNPTYLSGRVSNSRKRSSVEAAIKKRIREIEPKFKTTKGKPQRHWYRGDLRDLAREVHLEAEYEIIQKQLSGVVHASAYALQEEPLYSGFLLADFAWRFSFRVLGKFSEYAEIELTETQLQLVRMSADNVFDDPTTRSS